MSCSQSASNYPEVFFKQLSKIQMKKPALEEFVSKAIAQALNFHEKGLYLEYLSVNFRKLIRKA